MTHKGRVKKKTANYPHFVDKHHTPSPRILALVVTIILLRQHNLSGGRDLDSEGTGQAYMDRVRPQKPINDYESQIVSGILRPEGGYVTSLENIR